MNTLLIGQLPVEKWVSDGVDWITQHLSGLFNVIQSAGNTIMTAMTDGLLAIPMFLMIAGIFMMLSSHHLEDGAFQSLRWRAYC